MSDPSAIVPPAPPPTAAAAASAAPVARPAPVAKLVAAPAAPAAPLQPAAAAPAAPAASAPVARPALVATPAAQAARPATITLALKATPAAAPGAAPAVLRPPAVPPPAPVGAAGKAADKAVGKAGRRPMASPARPKRRHWGLLASFLAIVVLPATVSGTYLAGWAVDQYASTLGFTVRSEDTTSASSLLGGLGAALGGGSISRDGDILFEFIRSQELVAAIDGELDLRSLYARHHAGDPVFGFDPTGTVEDLTAYWQRMVRISYDASSGLIELRVLAFEPGEARAIAIAIDAHSTKMINNMSAIARTDATRYAREDLDLALERLKTAREALTAFRVENQIVDVSADIQGQMGLLANLQGQLANALIEMDLLRDATGDTDPRMTQARSRIAVIEARIEEERRKFSTAGLGPGGKSYATTIGEFERLTVDREFAERAYIAALSMLDAARADANRQSRYLAAYIGPTLAERSEFPRGGLLSALVLVFSSLIWSILCLIYYSLRDRR